MFYNTTVVYLLHISAKQTNYWLDLNLTPKCFQVVLIKHPI